LREAMMLLAERLTQTSAETDDGGSDSTGLSLAEILKRQHYRQFI
jgi:hypothetical protein